MCMSSHDIRELCDLERKSKIPKVDSLHKTLHVFRVQLPHGAIPKTQNGVKRRGRGVSILKQFPLFHRIGVYIIYIPWGWQEAVLLFSP